MSWQYRAVIHETARNANPTALSRKPLAKISSSFIGQRVS
jgi:hypothetical protein